MVSLCCRTWIFHVRLWISLSSDLRMYLGLLALRTHCVSGVAGFELVKSHQRTLTEVVQHASKHETKSCTDVIFSITCFHWVGLHPDGRNAFTTLRISPRPDVISLYLVRSSFIQTFPNYAPLLPAPHQPHLLHCQSQGVVCGRVTSMKRQYDVRSHGGTDGRQAQRWDGGEGMARMCKNTARAGKVVRVGSRRPLKLGTTRP